MHPGNRKLSKRLVYELGHVCLTMLDHFRVLLMFLTDFVQLLNSWPTDIDVFFEVSLCPSLCDPLVVYMFAAAACSSISALVYQFGTTKAHPQNCISQNRICSDSNSCAWCYCCVLVISENCGSLFIVEVSEQWLNWSAVEPAFSSRFKKAICFDWAMRND